MIDDLIKQIQELQDSMKSSIPILEKEIDSIIQNKEKSSNEIEKILDILLDYLHIGLGKEQFVKLNSYYNTFCPEYSAEYNEFYKKIID